MKLSKEYQEFFQLEWKKLATSAKSWRKRVSCSSRFDFQSPAHVQKIATAIDDFIQKLENKVGELYKGWVSAFAVDAMQKSPKNENSSGAGAKDGAKSGDVPDNKTPTKFAATNEPLSPASPGFPATRSSNRIEKIDDYLRLNQLIKYPLLNFKGRCSQRRRLLVFGCTGGSWSRCLRDNHRRHSCASRSRQ